MASVTTIKLAIPWLCKVALPFWLTKPRTLHNACGRWTDRLCASFRLPLTHAQSCKFCSKVDQFFFMSMSWEAPVFPQPVSTCHRLQMDPKLWKSRLATGASYTQTLKHLPWLLLLVISRPSRYHVLYHNDRFWSDQILLHSVLTWHLRIKSS